MYIYVHIHIYMYIHICKCIMFGPLSQPQIMGGASGSDGRHYFWSARRCAPKPCTLRAGRIDDWRSRRPWLLAC